jgi:integrase
MAIFKRKGSPFYFVGFEFAGRRYRQSTRTTNKRSAEEFERQLRQQLYDQAVLGKKPHEPMRLEDAVKRYVTTHLKTKERLEKTAKSQTYLLARLTTLIGPDTLLDEITTASVADLKERLFDGGRRKPATPNQYLATLRAILRKAHHEWGRLRELPRFTLYSLKNERTRWLTEQEEQRLLAACQNTPHLCDLVTFLLDTGARLGEACRLTWDKVRLPLDAVGEVELCSKTGKPRTVPLTARADRLLRELYDRRPEGQPRVFLVRTVGTHWRGTRPQAKPFTNPHGAWYTAVEAANLHDLRVHDLRHTFSSRLVQRGVPLQTVSQLLGHASLKMTLRYAHLATANLREAVSKLNQPSPELPTQADASSVEGKNR